MKVSSDKSAWEVVIRLLFAATALLYAATAFGQNTFETYCDDKKVVAVISGRDELMIRADGHAGTIQIEHLDQAGATAEERFVSLLMMADDGADDYRTFILTTGAPRNKVSRDYWRKGRWARQALLRLLEERTIVYLTHKHRRYAEIN